MFDQTFVDTHARTRKPWTFSASIAMQTGIVAVALIVPLTHPEILRPNITPLLVFTLRPVQPPPAVVTNEPVVHRGSHALVVPTRVPTSAPRDVPLVMDAPEDIRI